MGFEFPCHCQLILQPIKAVGHVFSSAHSAESFLWATIILEITCCPPGKILISASNVGDHWQLA